MNMLFSIVQKFDLNGLAERRLRMKNDSVLIKFFTWKYRCNEDKDGFNFNITYKHIIFPISPCSHRLVVAKRLLN
ncbi:hypothetical protein V6N13_088115 [Hibiscus sabdariffa]